MGKFLRKLYIRKYFTLLLILIFAFSLVAPGFAQASSGPSITITSSSSYSTSNPNLSFSVSSTVQLDQNSASMTVDGNSVAVNFTYTGYYDCPDCDPEYVITSYTSGTITGTPMKLHDGSHTITVTMKDVNGNSTTNQWTINVNQVPTLTSPTPANGAALTDNSGAFSVKFNDNDAIDQTSIVATLDNVQVPAVFEFRTLFAHLLLWYPYI